MDREATMFPGHTLNSRPTCVSGFAPRIVGEGFFGNCHVNTRDPQAQERCYTQEIPG